MNASTVTVAVVLPALPNAFDTRAQYLVVLASAGVVQVLPVAPAIGALVSPLALVPLVAQRCSADRCDLERRALPDRNGCARG